jgi:hypothetical protein
MSSADPGWVKVAVATDDIEAHLIAGRLEGAGIDVLMEPDRTGLGDYLMGGHNPRAPVWIFVPEIAAEEAALTLEGDANLQDDGPVTVAERSDPPLAAPSGRPVTWWIAVAIIAVILLGFFLGDSALVDVFLGG